MIILGGPSGVGKSTVISRVRSREPRLSFSVSHTTRPPRASEQDGVAYHFVQSEQFESMVSSNAFAEWAPVHAHHYGTSHAEIERILARGDDILFDIDVQGAEQLVGHYPHALTIFMVPPDLEELERRLRNRGTEDEAHVQLRLANALKEIGEVNLYDYVVVNDDLDRAVDAFCAILTSERCKRERCKALVDQLQKDPSRQGRGTP